jgi:hypothetical protein
MRGIEVFNAEAFLKLTDLVVDGAADFVGDRVKEVGKGVAGVGWAGLVEEGFTEEGGVELGIVSISVEDVVVWRSARTVIRW